MTAGDGLVAVVYQIGGRHRSSERGEREVYASELADADDGSIPNAKARAAYRQRIATQGAAPGWWWLMGALADFETAGAQLDAHLRSCPSCSRGKACSDGDAAAETEFRSWRELQRRDPETAAMHPARHGWT